MLLKSIPDDVMDIIFQDKRPEQNPQQFIFEAVRKTRQYNDKDNNHEKNIK